MRTMTDLQIYALFKFRCILFCVFPIYFPHNKINRDECTLYTHISEYIYICKVLIQIRRMFNIPRKITMSLCDDSNEWRDSAKPPRD